MPEALRKETIVSSSDDESMKDASRKSCYGVVMEIRKELTIAWILSLFGGGGVT